MRFLQHIFLLIVGTILFLIGSVGVYISFFYIVGRVDFSSFQILHFVLQDNAYLCLAVSFIIIFLSCLVIIITHILDKEKGFYLSVGLQKGDLKISSSAIEDFLKNFLQEKERENLKRVDIRLSLPSAKGLKIVAKLEVLKTQENIPALSQRIHDYIQESIGNFIGYPNTLNIYIRIQKIT